MHYIKSSWFFLGCVMSLHSVNSSPSMRSFEDGIATKSVIAVPSSIVVPLAIQADDPTHFDSYVKYLLSIKNGMSSIKVEKVSFSVNKNGSSNQTFIRNGFLVTRPDALGTVIICHGYTQSKHESFFFRALFSHFNVLAFDFRAHGDLTDNQHSTIGQDELHDVYGAVQFVKNSPIFLGKPVIGLGFSMGAVALLLAQAHYGNLFEMLILDTPFDSSNECMGRRIDEMLSYKLLPGKKLIKGAIMKALYNPRLQAVAKPIFQWASGLDPNLVRTQFVPVIPIDMASKITVPCFFVSCECDTKVTVASVKRLYDAVRSPFKRLWITQGMRHCGSCLAQPELYFYKVNKFIKKCLNKQWKNPSKIIDNRVAIHAG